jgi:predicted PurR-regulated permease PerM
VAAATDEVTTTRFTPALRAAPTARRVPSRAFALGVVVTAFIQSAISAFGLFIAGIPFASVLSALMFMLCIAQLGPAVVLVPAVIWLFATGDTGWGIFLAIVGVAAITVENFVRPVLIRRGVHLPLLLILAGVIGGLIACQSSPSCPCLPVSSMRACRQYVPL